MSSDLRIFAHTQVLLQMKKHALLVFSAVLAAAAVSEIPYHAAFVLQDNGQIVKSEIFDRRVVEE